MLHELVTDLTSLSIISDSGSGFKAKVAVLGMLYLSQKDLLPGKMKISTWMYPAAGEGKQPETDSMMPYLKQNQCKYVQYFRGKAASKTAQGNTAESQFSGGLPFTTVRYLELPVDDLMSPPAALDGITLYLRDSS